MREEWPKTHEANQAYTAAVRLWNVMTPENQDRSRREYYKLSLDHPDWSLIRCFVRSVWDIDEKVRKGIE